MTITADREMTAIRQVRFLRAGRPAALSWRRTLRAVEPWMAPWRAARRIAEQERDINLLILTIADVTERLAEAQTAQARPAARRTLNQET